MVPRYDASAIWVPVAQKHAAFSAPLEGGFR